MVAQACNPSTLGGRGWWITRSRGRDHPGQHGETPSLLKIQKISWAWWHVPVIPATQEDEAGELPEPRRRRLRWAEITPLHSSLGNKSETPSQKKKNYLMCHWNNSHGIWGTCLLVDVFIDNVENTGMLQGNKYFQNRLSLISVSRGKGTLVMLKRGDFYFHNLVWVSQSTVSLICLLTLQTAGVSH